MKPDADPFPLLIHYHSRAMARLASGTALVIATLLAVPDAVALLPSSPSPVVWLIRLVSVWLSALILWFASYFCLLNLVGWLTSGITVDHDGIRLWRLGRLIRWPTVKAISLEPQLVFSRVFSLTPPAHRLTLYIQKPADPELSPQNIPSFLFKEEDFHRLVAVISSTVFSMEPDCQNVLVAPAAALPELKKLYRLLSWARIVVSLIIAASLICFLGRRAAVNYIYNEANASFKKGAIGKARKEYEFVTSMDPYNAFAWQNLAGAEFRLGRSDRAVYCWERALALKPDLVEPKVSLSYIYMRRRQFAPAREVLERALKLAPENIDALTNLADLEMREGHVAAARRTARLVLTLDPGNRLARCQIAAAAVHMGDAQSAIAFITSGAALGAKESPAYCRLVQGQALLMLGKAEEAEMLFKSVLVESPDSSEALIGLSRVMSSRRQWKRARELLRQACRLNPVDPSPVLALSEFHWQQGETADATTCLADAIALPAQDAGSLSEAARLSLAFGLSEQARQLCRRALAMEHLQPVAARVMETLSNGK